jgi:hypothetical protein
MIELSITQSKAKLGQISGDDYQAIHLVREHFSIANPAYRRNAPYIQARLYAITPAGKFELGLLGSIITFLELNHYEYVVSEQLQELCNVGFANPEIKTLNLQYRDYQEASVISALKQGNGVTLIPTAGGKTLICAGLIESLRLNLKNRTALTLVMVPTLQLVEQTANDFISYGLTNVTKWSGDNIPDPKANIIVAGTQILLSDKTDLSILDDAKILLVDECLRKNTLISTNKGYIKIQNIKVGDFVKSFNIETGKIEYKSVLNTWHNLPQSSSYDYFLEIKLEDGTTIQVTPNHKIFTNRGYVKAEDLTVLDEILSIKSSKTMTFRYKYLYAKASISTLLFNMSQTCKVCWQTFKTLPSRIYPKNILRCFFKKTQRRNMPQMSNPYKV